MMYMDNLIKINFPILGNFAKAYDILLSFSGKIEIYLKNEQKNLPCLNKIINPSQVMTTMYINMYSYKLKSTFIYLNSCI